MYLVDVGVYSAPFASLTQRGNIASVAIEVQCVGVEVDDAERTVEVDFGIRVAIEIDACFGSGCRVRPFGSRSSVEAFKVGGDLGENRVIGDGVERKLRVGAKAAADGVLNSVDELRIDSSVF